MANVAEGASRALGERLAPRAPRWPLNFILFYYFFLNRSKQHCFELEKPIKKNVPADSAEFGAGLANSAT